MKVTQMPPVHAANLVANSGNTAYGVDVISECDDPVHGSGPGNILVWEGSRSWYACGDMWSGAPHHQLYLTNSRVGS